MANNKIESAEKAFLAKSFHSSLKGYLSLIEDDPKNSFIRQRVAECYYVIGDYEKSILACHEALALDSDLSIPHVLLAYIYNRTNRKNESINEAKAAYIIQPESERVLECYGTVLLSNGEIDSAIPLFVRALSKNPNLESVRNNLAIAYRIKGNYRQYFTEMKRLFGDNRSLKNFLKLFTAFEYNYAVALVVVVFVILFFAYIFNMKGLLLIPGYFIAEGYVNVLKFFRVRNLRNAAIYFASNTSLLILVYIIYVNS